MKRRGLAAALGVGALLLCGAPTGFAAAKDTGAFRVDVARPETLTVSDKTRRAGERTLGGFSRAELELLESGKSVKRRFSLTQNGATYRAGFSYRLVEATPMDVIRALRRPGGVVQVIPYGLEATTLSEKNGITRMRITQGKRPVVGTYTVKLEWDLSTYQARFWLDPTFEHDIEDVWGVFAAREVRPGLTLVSFGFAFDIGGVGTILESKAQNWGLTTADRIAEHLEKK